MTGPARPAGPATTILILFVTAAAAAAAPRDDGWHPIALSDSLGTEISSEERDAYHLFPDLDDFAGGRIVARGDRDRHYRLEYARAGDTGGKPRSVNLAPEMVDTAERHVRLVEAYRTAEELLPVEEGSSAPGLHDMEMLLALRFAASGRYDVAAALIEDWKAVPPPPRGDAAGWDDRGLVYGDDIIRLSQADRALFLESSLLDREGSLEMIIFSGFYGIWAGIATPILFDAESPQAYAAGLLIGPASAILLNQWLSRDAEMGEGRAAMIRVGGFLGTWQGLGWPAVADENSDEIIAMGLGAGIAGIAAAAALTHNVTVTEGHGAISEHALLWGTWYGLVAAKVGGATEGDALMQGMLIGSDALVAAAVIGARDSEMPRGRVALITLGGAVGVTAGFGASLLAEVESDRTMFAIAGAGSLAGLWGAWRMTRDMEAEMR